MKVFFSYHFDAKDRLLELFAHRVCYYLRKQPGAEVYCHVGEYTDAAWDKKVAPKVRSSDQFVLFLGSKLGSWQEQEYELFKSTHPDAKFSCVKVPDAASLSDKMQLGCAGRIVDLAGREILERAHGEQANRRVLDEVACETCAVELFRLLNIGTPIGHDGLPLSSLTEYETPVLLSGEQPEDLGLELEYEKLIIDKYMDGNGQLLEPRYLQAGCPQRWPAVPGPNANCPKYKNPVQPANVGAYCPVTDAVVVDTRASCHQVADGRCLAKLGLTIPEARPREMHVYPRRPRAHLVVGILVSGGIAPGINAVVEGIVRRHGLYNKSFNQANPTAPYKLEIRGYRDGFAGLLDGNFATLYPRMVEGWASRGGSMLGTSRSEGLLDTREPAQSRRRSEQLDDIASVDLEDVDILYVLGGDGSMKAAHAIWTRAKAMQAAGRRDNELSVVAIPKTMDNDILWVWQSFGFLSAVEKAREFVTQLHTEASSNPRLCIIQLFGSESGFVVSHTALASGVCNLALIPESEFSMANVSEYLIKHLLSIYQQERPDVRPRGGIHGSPYGIVLMAETAIPRDVGPYLAYESKPAVGEDGKPMTDKEGKPVVIRRQALGLEDDEVKATEKYLKDGCRVHGQTPDELRRAGLKIVSRVLQEGIGRITYDSPKFWERFRVFTNEPRHLLRALDPSVQDVIFAQRLGTLAVDNAMAGLTDFMISQWLTEFVVVPLPLVVLGRKRVRKNGIFWKSVLNSTGQPESLV